MKRSTCVLGLALFLLGGCQPSSPADKLMGSAEALKRGELIYIGTCGGYCHNRSAGAADAPNLFDCTWLHGGSDQEIFNTIQAGVPGTRMIGFKGKMPEGEDDIWKLVAYLKSKRSC